MHEPSVGKYTCLTTRLHSAHRAAHPVSEPRQSLVFSAFLLWTAPHERLVSVALGGGCGVSRKDRSAAGPAPQVTCSILQFSRFAGYRRAHRSAHGLGAVHAIVTQSIPLDVTPRLPHELPHATRASTSSIEHPTREPLRSHGIVELLMSLRHARLRVVLVSDSAESSFGRIGMRSRLGLRQRCVQSTTANGVGV